MTEDVVVGPLENRSVDQFGHVFEHLIIIQSWLENSSLATFLNI